MDAAARAREAQRAWWAAGFAHRRKVLLRAHDLLLERRELLLDAVQTETGKTRGQAFEELFNAAAATRYGAVSARRVLSGGRRRAGIPLVMQTRVQHRPRRASSASSPPGTTRWPWRSWMSLPPSPAGNGVVQKADNQGALTILAARRAFIDAGVPAELWGVVAGDGPDRRQRGHR